MYLWAKSSLEDRQDPEKRKIFKAKLEEVYKNYQRIPRSPPAMVLGRKWISV